VEKRTSRSPSLGFSRDVQLTWGTVPHFFMHTSVPSPKYKHKNNGPPVKVILYMDEHCEHKVQLKAERVCFIKSWSKFVGKGQLDVDDTIVFTPIDNDFQVEVYR
jgi:hypothetical protein